MLPKEKLQEFGKPENFLTFALPIAIGNWKHRPRRASIQLVISFSHDADATAKYASLTEAQKNSCLD
jgi:hypothetical protein